MYDQKVADLEARVAELEAMKDRILKWADDMEKESPQLGRFFAASVRDIVRGAKESGS